MICFRFPGCLEHACQASESLFGLDGKNKRKKERKKERKKGLESLGRPLWAQNSQNWGQTPRGPGIFVKIEFFGILST